MLRLFGSSTVERAKSLAVGGLAALLVLSLWQLTAENAQAARDDQNRQAVTGVASRFAVALTTYDYAHPDLQISRVAAVSSRAVVDRVSASSGDLAAAKVASIGEVRDTRLVTGPNSAAEVLVSTVQVVSNIYAAAGTTLSGLLYVALIRLGTGWEVTNFRWLLSPTSAP